MKSIFLSFTLTTALLFAAETSEKADSKALGLLVDSQSNPTAVNSPLPRLSWRVESSAPDWVQKSYHILAASSVNLLNQNKGDLWDSGETPSLTTQFIQFGGAPLKSGQQVHWKVRSASRSGLNTNWSEPATFTAQLSGPAPLPEKLFLADAPRLSHFECSDEDLTALYEAAGKRLHEITSLRDMAFAMRAASYHQSLLPRGRDWTRVCHHSVDDSGFYPATIPSDGSFGSTRSDAVISATHAIWWMSGDRSLIDRHMPTMQNYVFARIAVDPKHKGQQFGELPSDTLPANDSTPQSFVHITTQAANLRLMLDMYRYSTKNPYAALALQKVQNSIAVPFRATHINPDSSLKHQSPTATLMALRSGLLEPAERARISAQFFALAKEQNSTKAFTQSPYLTANLLPGLQWTANPERALALTLALETEELSPLALACSSEWLMSTVAGITADSPGFRNIVLNPMIPPEETLSFVKAHFDAPTGRISVQWRFENHKPVLEFSLPANTNSRIRLANSLGTILSADGKPIASRKQYALESDATHTTIRVESGNHQFRFTD